MKQVAIVGGGGGLGNALVTQLLDRDWAVAVTGRTPPRDPRVQCFYPLDPTSADWRAVYQQMEKYTDATLDAIVFVAGTAVFGRTVRIPVERARATFELNFWSCTSAARAAAEYWSEKGRSGAFVAVLSVVARRAVPFEAYYAASKAATARFLECLQLEYAGRGLEFISVFPGSLQTPFRQRAEWYGLAPVATDGGASVRTTARAIVDVLTGRRRSRVIGWRERSIALADRLVPGLYDRIVLRPRVRKALTMSPAGEPEHHVTS